MLIAFILGILAALVAMALLRHVTNKSGSEFRYCPLCSSCLSKKELAGRVRLTCLECGFVHWDNPKPVVVILVPMNGGLVLVKRKAEPAAGSWALPGGFMEGCEGPEEAAIRETFEETGLTVEIDRLLGVFKARSGVNQIILLFLAKPATGTPAAGDDATDAREFQRADLPQDIPFKLHQQAITKWFAGEIKSTT